jgi:nitroimidazol reductase NimA-like FMN-containing flavoprotein (pyridoxamine 5'-phosphate oxidase superfamily)
MKATRAKAIGCTSMDPPPAVTATPLDGLVLGRSVFRHAINYSLVVVLGQARVVTDPGEKTAALSPTGQELKSATVLAQELDEVTTPGVPPGVMRAILKR